MRRLPDGGIRIAWSAPHVDVVRILAIASGGDGGERLIGTGSGVGHLVLTADAAVGMRFFRLVPRGQKDLILADRFVPVDGTANLRDIGGYRTLDGRWVKMGMLYRSDKLSRLTPDGEVQLGALDLALIADLRSPKEVEKEPDRLPPNVGYRLFDIMGDSAAPDNFVQGVSEGRAPEIMRDLNRDLVASPMAQREFGKLLHAIGASNGPILYHCTAGKDRTGWASAVLLTILGVPREAVIYDYIISRHRLKSVPVKNIIGDSDSALGSLPRELVDPLVFVDSDYIEAAFDEVEKRYGDFDTYVRVGLGINPAKQDKLRALFLTGKPWAD